MRSVVLFAATALAFLSALVAGMELWSLVFWSRPHPSTDAAMVVVPFHWTVWLVRAPIVWLSFGAFYGSMTFPRYHRRQTLFEASALGTLGGAVACLVLLSLPPFVPASLFQALASGALLPGLIAGVLVHVSCRACQWAWGRA